MKYISLLCALYVILLNTRVYDSLMYSYFKMEKKLNAKTVNKYSNIDNAKAVKNLTIGLEKI